jgi:hypothetical protein
MDLDKLDTRRAEINETLRLRWVGKILNELERRELLAQDAAKPAGWRQGEAIDAHGFAAWLAKHLNVAGWRELLDIVRKHNEAHPEAPWDHAWPPDMLDAVEAVIERDRLSQQFSETLTEGTEQTNASGASVVPVKEDDSAPRWMLSEVEAEESAFQTLGDILSSRVEGGSEVRPPALAWLLAPRAAAAVVKAQATSAQAFAELKRARSEAMLHALHAYENDARSTAVLSQIEDLRERLGPRLRTYCQEHGIPVPARDTEEEANLLFLINAQLIALDDARDEIARRGAELAREKIRIAEKNARVNVAAANLPLRLEGETQANPLEEKLLCEQMRHRSASWVARIVGTVGGGFTGVVTSLTDVVIASIAETAMITGPALVTFIMSLFVETLGHAGPMTGQEMGTFAITAVWNSLLVLGLTLAGFAAWRYLDKKTKDLHKKARQEREQSMASTEWQDRYE